MLNLWSVNDIINCILFIDFWFNGILFAFTLDIEKEAVDGLMKD